MLHHVVVKQTFDQQLSGRSCSQNSLQGDEELGPGDLLLAVHPHVLRLDYSGLSCQALAFLLVQREQVFSEALVGSARRVPLLVYSCFP
jgi:hypothetical protein